MVGRVLLVKYLWFSWAKIVVMSVLVTIDNEDDKSEKRVVESSVSARTAGMESEAMRLVAVLGRDVILVCRSMILCTLLSFSCFQRNWNEG